jgi:hypothetical protein
MIPPKKLKSMISEMEACQKKMYEAMADVQKTSIAAIQATTASTTPPQHATTVGAVIGTVAAPEVMIEQANVAMMKLTGILKSKEKKACRPRNQTIYLFSSVHLGAHCDNWRCLTGGFQGPRRNRVRLTCQHGGRGQ